MAIDRPDLYLESAWNWDILKGCFGEGKIEPTDLDGFVEKNGHFLVLEAKKSGVPIKRGQLIAFERLQRTGLFTIIVMWGEQNQPEEMLVFYPIQGLKGQTSITLENIRGEVRKWYQEALDNPKTA